MLIDDQLILKLENLAKLNLSVEEKFRLKEELGKIIGMFSLIAEVNTEGVEPLVHMTDSYNQWRLDEAEISLTMEAAQVNAPKIIDNMFAVPRVIE